MKATRIAVALVVVVGLSVGTVGVAMAGGQNGNDGGNHHGFVLCHKPPGNPSNAHTITVGSFQAVLAHLAHGDHLGPCHDNVH